MNSAGYISLRRVTEEDRWVANYNPQLLLAAEAHVHIEITETVDVVEYMFEYIFKRADHIKFIPLARPEEQQVLEHMSDMDKQVVARFLSAAEATGHILGYHLCRKETAVLTLPVHDKGQYSVRYLSGEELAASSRLSYLDRWLCRPKEAIFDKIRYHDYYEQYRVVKNLPENISEFYKDCPADPFEVRYVIPEKARKNARICRLNSVYILKTELWHLRQVLLKAEIYPRSWDQLKCFTASDNTTQTFQTYGDVTAYLGIVLADQEAEAAMDEAINSFLPPPTLRFLFSILLLNGYAARTDLYDKYKTHFMRDFTAYLTEEDAEAESLNNIEHHLLSAGKTLQDFGFKKVGKINKEVLREYERYDPIQCKIGYETLRSSMSPDQEEILSEFISDIQSGH